MYVVATAYDTAGRYWWNWIGYPTNHPLLFNKIASRYLVRYMMHPCKLNDSNVKYDHLQGCEMYVHYIHTYIHIIPTYIYFLPAVMRWWWGNSIHIIDHTYLGTYDYIWLCSYCMVCVWYGKFKGTNYICNVHDPPTEHLKLKSGGFLTPWSPRLRSYLPNIQYPMPITHP